MKKNILHIIDTTGPGGAETVFIDLLSSLDPKQYNSIVLIRGEGWVSDELHRREFKPVILDAKGSFNWRYIIKLVRLIRKNKIDVIQSHLLGSNVYASIAGLLSFCPVVSVFHGGVDISTKERFQWLKYTAINLGSRKIIAVSESLKQELLERTILNKNKMEVIYNGIDVKKFDVPVSTRIRTLYGWTDKEIIIGCLGNIRPAKGYDILLKAAAKLKLQSSNIRFVIAGQGKTSLERELCDLQKQLDVEDIVKFVGFCQEPEEFLSNIDIFLLSSISEGFSIATIQAMAAGRPVIATKCGGPEEIIQDGVTGVLIEKNNPDAIVESIQQLQQNPEVSEALVNNANTELQQSFDMEGMLSSYRNIYSAF